MCLTIADDVSLGRRGVDGSDQPDGAAQKLNPLQAVIHFANLEIVWSKLKGVSTGGSLERVEL